MGVKARTVEQKKKLVERVQEKVASGASVEDACKSLKISNQTYYTYKKALDMGPVVFTRVSKSKKSPRGRAQNKTVSQSTAHNSENVLLCIGSSSQISHLVNQLTQLGR